MMSSETLRAGLAISSSWPDQARGAVFHLAFQSLRAFALQKEMQRPVQSFPFLSGVPHSLYLSGQLSKQGKADYIR